MTAPTSFAPPAAGIASPQASPTSSVRRKGRIAPLDGLRGIAIALVLVMHYYVEPETPATTLHAVLKKAFCLSYCGVDLFFVLSGFLIGGVLLDYRASPRLLPVFYLRRFLRIIPLYVILLVSFFACREIPSLAGVTQGWYFKSAVPLWPYFFMLQNVVMSFLQTVGPFWLGPTWSLAVEEQFYLVAPYFVRRLSRRHVAYGCVLAFVLCPMLRLAMILHGQNYLAPVFLAPLRVESLLGGVLCAIVVRDETLSAGIRRHGGFVAGLLLVLGIFLAVFSSAGLSASAPIMSSFGYTVLALFFTLAVLGVLLFPASRAARLLSSRLLGALGIVSYFVYLFHMPFLYLAHWAFRHGPPRYVDAAGASATVIALVLTLLAAAVSWRYFEKPLLQFGRNFRYA